MAYFPPVRLRGLGTSCKNLQRADLKISAHGATVADLNNRNMVSSGVHSDGSSSSLCSFLITSFRINHFVILRIGLELACNDRACVGKSLKRNYHCNLHLKELPALASGANLVPRAFPLIYREYENGLLPYFIAILYCHTLLPYFIAIFFLFTKSVTGAKYRTGGEFTRLIS